MTLRYSFQYIRLRSASVTPPGANTVQSGNNRSVQSLCFLAVETPPVQFQGISNSRSELNPGDVKSHEPLRRLIQRVKVGP